MSRDFRIDLGDSLDLGTLHMVRDSANQVKIVAENRSFHGIPDKLPPQMSRVHPKEVERCPWIKVNLRSKICI